MEQHDQTWKNSIVSQLSGRVNGLKKLKNADFKSKLAVATGIIQSKIQYLLPLYGGAPKYLLEAVQVQQLKAARFVCGYGSYYWSTTKLLKTCGFDVSYSNFSPVAESLNL